MQQEVYADLYVLVNAGMDLLCLMITSALLHRKPGRLRAFLASLLGGGYALAVLLLGATGLPGILADLLAAFGVCALAFAHKRLRIPELIRITAVYALVSALLGGVMTSLFAWLNRLDLPLDVLRGDSLSVWVFSILAVLAGSLTMSGGKLFRRAGSTEIVTVEAVLFGTSVSLRAMVDSGNLLRDPLSGKSVIVADVSALQAVLPPDFPLSGVPSTPLPTSVASKIRYIPALTASGRSLLAAIVPDSLFLVSSRGRIPSDLLVAPSHLNSPSFDALLPGE